MDYRLFVQRHRDTGADITLSVVPIDETRASSFGLMQIDDRGKVIDFREKPTGELLKQMQVDTTVLGLTPEQARNSPYIASMGIYVFSKAVMKELLEANSEHTDFGHEVIPASMQKYNIQAYLFNDYWQDIGTIEAFYNANLSLTRQPKPSFSFYHEDAPIYTRARYLPPSKLLDCRVTESIIGEGCILKDCRINNSVLGLRSRVEAGTVIEDSLIMGADYYQSLTERLSAQEQGQVTLGIGKDTVIRRAIIDKNACIGNNVKIFNKDRVEEANCESEGFYIRNGIVVVIKNAVIPHGAVIQYWIERVSSSRSKLGSRQTYPRDRDQTCLPQALSTKSISLRLCYLRPCPNPQKILDRILACTEIAIAAVRKNRTKFT